MSPLVPEAVDVSVLVESLEGVGWRNGLEYGLDPGRRIILENYIHEDVFDNVFIRINEDNLRGLMDHEKRRVLDEVKKRIRYASDKEFLSMLKYGVEVEVRKKKRVFYLIDYINTGRNVFYYGREIRFPIPGRHGHIRPDIILFINGIPIVVIEVKASTRIIGDVLSGTVESPVEEAVEQLKRYMFESQELFKYVQIAVAYADEKYYMPAQRLNSREEELPRQKWYAEGIDRQRIEDIVDLLKPSTLLNIIRWYVFFKGNRKIVARHPQYRASEKALKRIREYLADRSSTNRGLIWHWQGSGKSLTMFFIANRFYEEFHDRYPIVFFMVDRRELQEQLVNEFIGKIDAPKLQSGLKKIESIRELKDIIIKIYESEISKGFVAHRGVYIVLLQKFKPKELSELLESGIRIRKKEILFLIDEAHRSQYGILASMVKTIFPNAIRFAFTGTPVFSIERNTFKEFSDLPRELYLDVYFIGDSIRDGYTVPLVYDVIKEYGKGGGELKIKLSEEDIKRFIDEWFNEVKSRGYSILDEEDSIYEGVDWRRISASRREIYRYINKVKAFLENPKRLKKLAEYIAERIREDTEDFTFKAMVVVVNRKACVLMRKYLVEELKKKGYKDAEKMVEVVMTYQNNDPEVIKEYRESLYNQYGFKNITDINLEIRRRFKEEEYPKILVVTDMLITGFDAPILKVMYLDKPLHGHRLLQAIARVNRPYRRGIIQKRFGLIVDSIGLLKHIRETIVKYQLIADEKISEDLITNTLEYIDKEAERFEKLLEEVKSMLKNFKINGEDLSIDIDTLARMLKSMPKRYVLAEISNIIKPKLVKIAKYWDHILVNELITKIHDLITLYKSLGAHERKAKYWLEMKIIAYLYGEIIKYVRRGIPKDFWRDLLKLVYSRTEIEGFRKIIDAEISAEMLEKELEKIVADRNVDILAGRGEHLDVIASESYYLLRTLLLSRTFDPLYREIYNRLEKLRRKWINREIDTVLFLTELKNLHSEKKQYDETIKREGVEKGIVKGVELFIRSKYGIRSEIHLDNLYNALRELLGILKKDPRMRIRESDIDMIREALQEDLITVDYVLEKPEILDDMIDEVINKQIIPQIEGLINEWKRST